jgi:hypothetical protein
MYSPTLFLDLGTRTGWWVSVTPRPLSAPGKDPVPIVQEAGWTPGPVWTGTKILTPIGIRFPDRPARSQSLYRLTYPAHIFQLCYRTFAHPSIQARLINPSTHTFIHPVIRSSIHRCVSLYIYRLPTTVNIIRQLFFWPSGSQQHFATTTASGFQD